MGSGLGSGWVGVGVLYAAPHEPAANEVSAQVEPVVAVDVGQRPDLQQHLGRQTGHHEHRARLGLVRVRAGVRVRVEGQDEG